ncbi:UbiA family prenyltransferase [Candidatus Bathycorpusculum sp.]|uniref:UbiA family prenyltransferase n=1 Tax=Candidatus Bathycorpusculum sp. TaxID=2994959 RepID=UPI0028190B95|nr:UbiA family prenyltransferase [Candidatus Termitimicrobium sp.]MCL2685826.1 UbiA family prenyltransferase [Candidatus Termitimicrobium sp.]
MTVNIRKVTHFFVTSSLFLAINSALIVYFSASFYEIKVPPIILLQTFLTTIAVYGLNKVTDQTEDNINKPDQTTKFQAYFIIPATICYIITLITGIIEGPLFFLVTLIPLLIGFVYSVKISKTLPRLKEITGVKSISVTFSWAFICAVLPSLIGTVEPVKVALAFGYIFIQMFINVTIFDIIDIPGDKAANTKTIPQFLGKERTAYFLFIVNSMLLIWFSICFVYGLFIKYLPVTVFGMIYSYVLIWYFTKNSDKRFYAEVIVDGEWIPIVALLLLIS